MDLLRKSFDKFYDVIKPAVFYLTSKDPEVAHELFISSCKLLHLLKLEKIVLDNSANQLNPGFEISNAAGFNKNGEIPPSVLKYLGFDRSVIGTVTYENWDGNPRPRTARYPKTESLINWMGLPGIGAKEIADNLFEYTNEFPITISVMSTPGKQGDAALIDIESTVLEFRHLSCVDRFQLNTSCPNTHTELGNLDARKENEKWLKDMLLTVRKSASNYQEVELKVSPDLNEDDVDYHLEVSTGIVDRFVISNTTQVHDPRFISKSPGKGGASGHSVYERAFEVQKMFHRKIIDNSIPEIGITPCGGIDSVLKLRERALYCGLEPIKGFEVNTGFIFKGPKLLREFREYTE